MTSPPPDDGGAHGAARRNAPERTPRRRLLADRFARWAVTAGGMTIIVSILGILVFIIAEVAPLASGADVSAARVVTLAGEVAAVVGDEHRTHLATLGRDGHLQIVDSASGAVEEERWLLDALDPLPGGPVPGLVEVGRVPDESLLTAATNDGRLLVVPVLWTVTFEGDERRVRAALRPTETLEIDPDGQVLRCFSVNRDDDGSLGAAAVLADGRLALIRRTVIEDFVSGETRDSLERHVIDSVPGIERIVLDATARNLYGADANGNLFWWRVEDGRPQAPTLTPAGSGPITGLDLLIGDRSLLVGHHDGTIGVWFPVRNEGNRFELTRIRTFVAPAGPIETFAPSMRNKGFLAAGGGKLGLYHSTSERLLWSGGAPPGGITALAFAPKSDGAFVATPGAVHELLIDNPHPEVSLAAFFGRVWYEGYERPAFVWQSTGGTDEFEPKLSLTPLLVGTLKGTIYSLILAIPLGVFGAMYTSQFMHASLKRYIKPTVEIMAALPSVVLGFLAGLWLAPRIEGILPGLLLMLFVVPLCVLAAGWSWRGLSLGVRNRLPAGSEAFIQIFVVAGAIWLCIAASPSAETLLFGGSFQDWLLQATGLPFDQRNAVVVGLAMGFAVIPIIFSISEDAFSNVPTNLVSGSLALGANRWQTVTRVVLPSASPGIFSAIMIGFGRAVGETMIVLMATGNTPLLDWNMFNGFRTLSANIAVEIPEAPHGGTLYRTLFLAALLLFIFTFIANTAAELVRQRLRKRYAQL